MRSVLAVALPLLRSLGLAGSLASCTRTSERYGAGGDLAGPDAPLKGEGSGHDGHREHTHGLGCGCHHWSCPAACASPHACLHMSAGFRLGGSSNPGRLACT